MTTKEGRSFGPCLKLVSPCPNVLCCQFAPCFDIVFNFLSSHCIDLLENYASFSEICSDLLPILVLSSIYAEFTNAITKQDLFCRTVYSTMMLQEIPMNSHQSSLPSILIRSVKKKQINKNKR